MKSCPLNSNKKLEENASLQTDEFGILLTHLQRHGQIVSLFGRLVSWLNFFGLGFSLFFWLAVGFVYFVSGVLLLLAGNIVFHRLIARYLKKDEQIIDRVASFVKNTNDVRSLGKILELLPLIKWYQSHEGLYKAINEAIERLLALIQATDHGVLSEQQRIRLRYRLFRISIASDFSVFPEAHYSLLVLHALEHLGGKSDLLDVRRLLMTNYITDEVRAAAQHCAIVLQERIGRENNAEMLLRPISLPETGHTLLRPAEIVVTPPQFLLQAGNPSMKNEDANSPGTVIYLTEAGAKVDPVEAIVGEMALELAPQGGQIVQDH